MFNTWKNRKIETLLILFLIILIINPVIGAYEEGNIVTYSQLSPKDDNRRNLNKLSIAEEIIQGDWIINTTVIISNSKKEITVWGNLIINGTLSVINSQLKLAVTRKIVIA